MFAFMTVTITHQSDVKSGRRTRAESGSRSRTPAHERKERTFMDIFACRRCKKKKKKHRQQRGQRPRVDGGEGYSSTEDDYYSAPSGSSADGEKRTHGPCQKQLPADGKEEDSLRRPLQCEQGSYAAVAGCSKSDRQINDRIQTRAASLLDSWHSLPNLRSPSLAVRAMTLKLKSLQDSEADQDAATTRIKDKPKKRARFNESVDVILQDDNGDPLYAQIVRIKYDDDVSCDGGGSGAGDSGTPGLTMGGRLGVNNNLVDGKMAEKAPDGGRTVGPRRARPDAIRMDYMDIRRNAEGHKYLKCVIFIGEEFDRRRITVRTAMGGSRLVLIAYKTEPLGDGTYYWQQFVEKFRLPHAIDPNQVNAVMHSAGDLVIEAPLFDFEADT